MSVAKKDSIHEQERSPDSDVPQESIGKPYSLEVNGARANNLQDINLSISHNCLTTITGLSGSGKSSLAFDTVYAEGQRRYIETFSPYVRQFFDKLTKPDVDSLKNIRPSIAIQQRTRVTSSRSTVGSMTNINDYLKILWSNIAIPSCPVCGAKLTAWTPGSLASFLASGSMEVPDNFYLIAPLTLEKKFLIEEVERLKTLGFSRALNSDTHETFLLEEISPSTMLKEKFLLVLDRIKARSINIERLRTNIEQAFQLSEGCVSICSTEVGGKLINFHNYYFCESHSKKVSRPKSYIFSFNHPLGACSTCKGFGHTLEISAAKCIPDPRKTLRDHAIQCWSGPSAKMEYKELLEFCKKRGIPSEKPWRDLKKEDQDLIFNHKSKEFWGILPWFKWLERKTYKMHVRVFLSRYREPVICSDCKGTRLKQDALCYSYGELYISDLWSMNMLALREWISGVEKDLEQNEEKLLQLKDVLGNLRSRFDYLIDLGLPYLTLDRQARTLSGGETQRVNLATALGSELVSTQFVLDEPSVGLHPRDTERLTRAVTALSRKGNSLLVVEHDVDFIMASDRVLEIGPKSGRDGGRVTFNGPISKWSGIEQKDLSFKGTFSPKEKLEIRQAKARNLKDISLEIPLNGLVCITGVSGSGKSTLVHEVLAHAWDNREILEDASHLYGEVRGLEHISNLSLIDQSPLSKTPRANIATYSNIWDEVRNFLANTDLARSRSLSKSSFSFNVDAGRCPSCEGAGFIREDMQFLSDVFIPCEVCLGKRFQAPILEVTYRDKNVDDFLKMTIDECRDFFRDSKKISESADVLSLLGLGSLRLGHPLSELSGGEAQRLKLVPVIASGNKERSLLIFDEPTTGLHVHDVERLIKLFRILITSGHSVLCIEHNLTVISAANWIIDLGPEGGDGGGEVIVKGTPLEISKCEGSLTGKYLKRYLEEIKKRPAIELSKSTHALPAPSLEISGAREHNLKNISLTMPLETTIAITGVSGSGKSTLAKDIIFAEGQRRYLDCLSPYARQFIKELKKPDIDHVSSIPPTIYVAQHTFQPSPHSTVGTVSECYNFLRLLFAKVGTQYCPEHPDKPIAPLSPEEIASEIKSLKAKSVRILAPVIKMKKGNHREILERAIANDISEVRVDGVIAKPSSFLGELRKTKAHTIDLVIAKFNPHSVPADLLSDTITQALGSGGGSLIVLADSQEMIFSSERTCPECRKGFFKPDPEDLSFNSKRGKCQECEGTGEDSKGNICNACEGARLSHIGRNIRIKDLNIFEVCSKTPEEVVDFLHACLKAGGRLEYLESIIKELISKLQSLCSLGLNYIPLSRDCSTLSGGELQRLRLSAALGSPLSGVMYIFDEPSAGLHPDDNIKVLSKIKEISSNHNSVILIEHDPDSIRSCDNIIEIGPGAGKDGGELVYNGALSEFKSINSATSLALSALPPKPLKKTAPSKELLCIEDASFNNLKKISTKIPLRSFVVIAGVSGSGKSTFLHRAVAETLLHGKKKGESFSLNGCTITPTLPVGKVIYIDQKPIGINARSTPASYLGLWDEIRKLFAQTLEAKTHGWSHSFFSYNSGNGRCPECKGLGFMRLEMNFLAEAQVVCELCEGSRFREETNSVRYGGYSVSEVLKLTFDEARQVFANHRKIHRALKIACDLGLGYLTIGQPSSTLSGGESQRIKLVSELATPQRSHTLYILDEPTIGLHRQDVSKLGTSLRSLTELGHSVIVIEHDIDVIASSDWMLELGPGAGSKGGAIIAKGTPFEIMRGRSRWGEILSHTFS